MKDQPTVWIFFPSNAFAGAENRFTGLWNQLAPKMRLHLVMSADMQVPLEKKFPGSTGTGKIFFLKRPPENFADMRRLYAEFIREKVGSQDVLHFIEQHPLLLTGRKTLLTLTASGMQNYNVFGKSIQFLGVWLADRVDVLDPKVFQFLGKLFFYKKKKITLTSNSYCEVENFDSVPWEQKKDWLVFVGRFTRVKQILNLVKAVPAMYAALRHKAVNDLHFYFIGYGPLDEEVKEIMKGPSFEGIPITVKPSSRPQEILRHSKIFFSVQLYNNYPSRALIEAMSAQNIPVVTDNGQTRWLAKPEFSYYVPEAFTDADLAKAVEEVYLTPPGELSRKSFLAKELVMKEHTVEKMGEYYAGLYKELITSE